MSNVTAMRSHKDNYSKDDILTILQNHPEGQPDLDWFSRCIDFHTYPAPGILIGVYMVDYALDLLNAKPTEKLYAVSESPKCIPDAVQIIANCTTGNNRLRIVPIGRFAISMNKLSEDPTVEGVRVAMDPSKLKDSPALEAWFANSKEYDKNTMGKQLTDEILNLGRGMLTWEKVRIPVIPKAKWETAICSLCGEPVPSYLLEGTICAGCGSLKYFERVA